MKIYTEKIHQSTRFGLIDEVALATADANKCCATCGHYERVNRRGQINPGMGVCTLINRDRYCLFKCGEWSMK